MATASYILPNRVTAGCAWLILCAGAAVGQVSPPRIAEPAGLEAVEPGTADVGPLNSSLRVQRADLRVASDFDRVYRAPGRPGMLMRVDGALHAVFAESEYVRTKNGTIPIVPAGTTWIIGEANVGCTDPVKPVCNQQPAQQPYLLPGPNMPSLPRAPVEPAPANAVGLVALPRAVPIGRTVSEPSDLRVSTALAPAPLVSAMGEAVPAVSTGRTPMPATLDLSDPFYRRARLRDIAGRLGPK